MQDKPLILSFFLLFTFLISANSLGQAETDTKKTFQIGFVPQYIAQRGIRIDFEPLFKNSKHGLQISPQFYYNENEVHYSINPLYYNNKEKYEKMIGYGIGLHHKIFIQYYNDKKLGIYFAYGGEYAHFTMDYKSWEWVEYTNEGLEYLEYDLIDIQQNTDRIRIDMLIGFQFNFVENLFLDFYIGTGGVYSINTMNPSLVKPILKDGMYNYAFTGIYIPVGFRFGVRF